jgi:hypothetical protein
VSQQLLNGPYIISNLEQMAGKGMPKYMTPHVFENSRSEASLLYRALYDTLVQMMPEEVAGV